jgi:hypothetical protein
MCPTDSHPGSPRPGSSAKTWIASALLAESHTVGGLKKSDFEQIVQSAIDNGVAQLLHHVLSRSESWSEFPASFRESLTRPVRQSMAYDMVREQDLGPLLGQLHEAGIRYLLLKGAGLAFTHYERPFLRERCDTDILFADQATFDRAWVLLKSLGYQRRNTLSGEFVGYQHCCWRQIGSGTQQALDCHIKINDYLFYADAFGFDELLEHSVSIPQLAASARTLGPVHALLMACMHRVATIPLGNANRLIWLFDMYLLAESFNRDEWKVFLNLASDRAVCGTCKHSLDAAAKFFPLAVPKEIMEDLEKAAENEPFKPGEEMKRWQYYFQVFKSTRGLGNKARLIREHFLPSTDYLMEKYHTRNRLALPFLYVHRVFAGLKRYF